MPHIGRNTPMSTTINLHFSFGVIIVAVMAVRFVQRLRHPVPIDAAYSPARERAAARTLHLAFYFLVLYKGVNTEALPQLGQGPYYNIRFGLAMIPAVGLFCAYFVVTRRRLLSRVLVCSVLALTVASSLIGWVQTPYVEREALYGPSGRATEVAGKHDAAWLAAHYHGGNVLITYVNSQSMMFYLLTKHQFADRSFITDANGSQFDNAVAHPEALVRWIVMSSDSSNGSSPIWTALHRQTAWRQHFLLVATFGPTQIYERVDVAPRDPAAAATPTASRPFAGLGEARPADARAIPRAHPGRCAFIAA